MKKIWGEILFDIKSSFFLTLLLFVQLTIFFGVSLFSGQLKKEVVSGQNKSIYGQQGIEHYYITDNLVGEYEEVFFRDKDALGKLKIMYTKLKSNPYFEYLEMYDNPIVLMGENIEDEVLYRYEKGEGENHRGLEEGKTYNEVKSFWMSCNVSDVFEFQYQEGTVWTEEEKDELPIPIVLGSEYSDVFRVGDIIEGITPVNDNTEFKVHGILKKGEYVVHRGKVINLDRYVLIPLQDAKNVPITKEEESNQKILYLFKINGTLSSELAANELQTLIQEICDASGVNPSSKVEGATNSQSYILNESIRNILYVLEKMLAMLSVFSCIATILYILLKMDRNMEYYSILMLNGFSISQIMLILSGSLVLLLVSAEILAGVIYYMIALLIWKTPQISWYAILTYQMGIVLSVIVINYIKLKKIDVGFYIGGHE